MPFAFLKQQHEDISKIIKDTPPLSTLATRSYVASTAMTTHRRIVSRAVLALGILLLLVVPVASAILPHPKVNSSPLPSARRRRDAPVNNLDATIIVGLRGGADVPAADMSSAKIDLELTPAKVAGAAALAAFTIAIVKKIPRSGGHAPQVVRGLCANLGISELGATGLFHLGYFLHCFLVIAIMPRGLKSAVFSPAGVILLGTVFPLVESIKAAARSREDSASTSQTWLMYWTMHGIFSFASHDMAKVIKRFGPKGGKHWYEFQFYMVLWLILPFTDGAAIIYEMITKPYIVPFVAPIAKAAEGWLTTLALTIVNASHAWFVVFFFMALPTVLKRFAVIATGTAYPVAATIVAIASDNDGIADDKWLTYWSCFSLLYLGMISAERFVGKVPGLYTLCLACVLYLMLPIFEGSEAVFRFCLVPLLGLRESLLLKDSRKLARNMVLQLPKDRLGEAGQAAAQAFLDEANKLTAAGGATPSA